MKKWTFFFLTTAIAITLIYMFINSQIPQGKIIFSKPAYKDSGLAVYHWKKQHLIVKKNQKNEWLAIPTTEAQIKNIIRLKNKPAEQLPLYGETIAEGIKIVDTRKTHIASIIPELELLSSYPTPGTDDDKIIIDKDTNTLYYYKRGDLYKSYQVATGKDPSYTPEGTFIVKNKYDDVLNEMLGVRWLGLGVPHEKDNRAEMDSRAPEGLKYGIHGTNEPESIGNHASGGCIRMTNEEVMELYSLVQAGTKVEIIGSGNRD